MDALRYEMLADIKARPGSKQGLGRAEATINGDWEFRLLEVLPNSHREASLEGNLLTRWFKDMKSTNSSTPKLGERDTDPSSEYEALSYVWEDSMVPTIPYTSIPVIRINGHLVNISRNLHAALVRLRHPRNPRLFFVDQVCINQSDAAEKSRLVDRMFLIYGYCSRTILWLGEEAQESFRAMILLQGLSRVGREHREIDDLVRAVSQQLANPDPWIALGKLFDRQWWHRTWTIQELVFPRDVLVVCGGRQLFWKDMRVALATMLRIRNAQRLSMLTFQVSLSNAFEMDRSRRNTADRRETSAKSPRDDLLRVLSRYRHRNAGLPQDKVFALYRLARDVREAISEQSPLRIQPDYTKTVAEVYLEVAKFFVLYNRSLDLLYHCRRNEHEQISLLPTWSPDWSDVVQEPAPFQYKLCNVWNSSGKFHADCAERKLIVEASILDQVIHIGPVCREDCAPECTKGCTEHNVENYPNRVMAWLANCALKVTVSDRELLYVLTAGKNENEGPNERQSPMLPQQHEVGGDEIEVRDKTLYDRASRYVNLRQASLLRRVCLTTQGRIFLGPADAKSGDVLAIIMGAQMPFVLRRDGKGDADYEVVGASFVKGIMSGELHSQISLSSFKLINLI